MATKGKGKHEVEVDLTIEQSRGLVEILLEAIHEMFEGKKWPEDILLTGPDPLESNVRIVFVRGE